jgi:hypothetical protein
MNTEAQIELHDTHDLHDHPYRPEKSGFFYVRCNSVRIMRIVQAQAARNRLKTRAKSLRFNTMIDGSKIVIHRS